MSEPTRDPTELPAILREKRSAPTPHRDSDAGMWGMAKAWGIAFDFIFTIVAGALIGWGIDRWRSSAPTGIMIGLACGFVVAFIRIVRATMKQERLEQEERRKRP